MTIGVRTAYRLFQVGATAEEARLLLAAELGLQWAEVEAACAEAARLRAEGVRPVGA